MPALSGIAEHIWDEKYRLKNNDGEPIDLTVADTFTRVAKALAAPEKESVRSRWETEFYDILSDFSALPGGRILAGAGTGRDVTLMNCYVMGTVPDSLRGIMEANKESALTMQQGGGIGTDFSTLRPNGALIKKLGSLASGPLYFMDLWDAMCRSIMSAGTRRGAMMGTLRCDHPDIEAFIEAKKDGKRFRNFNLSVLVTAEFMEAVKLGHAWQLVFDGKVYKTVDARYLWDKIMRATYEYADPGVIFIDRINETNPLRSIERIACTNPCGEQPLPPYGACLLGSVNLSRMVVNPFSRLYTDVDWDRLVRTTGVFVRMLDNVLDVTNYPLEAQRKEGLGKRRIGVGITGLADLFVMLGMKYSSNEAAKLAGKIMATIRATAEEASSKLAEEKGVFPLYQSSFYGDATLFPKRRNSHLISIAPTGTISLLAGNVSSGIEPIFDLSLKRKVLQRDNTWQEFTVNDYAWDMWGTIEDGNPEKTDVWETAADLKPEHHLAMLAAVTPHVDSSVSKTINCPESIDFESFKGIYQDAYTRGIKSCTTYRPNKVTGSILSSESMAVKDETVGNVVELTKPLVRPEQLTGTTYRIKPSGIEHALFITINDVETLPGVRRPYEVFINTKNLEFVAWTTALTRMVSAVFRKGGDVTFVTEELRAVFDPRGGYFDGKEYVPSLIAGIGIVIEKHLTHLGLGNQDKVVRKRHCPKCQGVLYSKDGCWSCEQCTYASCG